MVPVYMRISEEKVPPFNGCHFFVFFLAMYEKNGQLGKAKEDATSGMSGRFLTA
jgi:hypothetical protein